MANMYADDISIPSTSAEAEDSGPKISDNMSLAKMYKKITRGSIDIDTYLVALLEMSPIFDILS